VGEFVKIAEIKDVLKNQMQVFNAKGQEILVINVEGELFAIEKSMSPYGIPSFLWKSRRRCFNLRFSQRQVQRQNWEIIRISYK
jgi:hypothetical protein